ncbi:nucleotide sugar dehydrogenase [candidate division KSB1 bacterium]|nr:nucleotide sugar dehydrogenase [candidate division KSB1 bacterium]
MKINVFGLGYVGCVSAACLARNGNYVAGIDVDELKVNMINNGRSPIVEPELQETIKKAVASNRLSATVNSIGLADISIVCVGTPSNENGSLQLDNIKKVAKQIGDYLREIDTYHVVNIRSTVLPGTIDETVIPILEKESRKKAGVDFGVCMNPEFMREGTSIYDYHNPPFTLIGELDKKSGNVIAGIFENLNAPIIRTSIKVAEMIKYTSNTFHALKVSFANEIGNICKNLDIDSHEVMDIFCQDTKLNLSSYYLKPGYAFGGSCLPKDLRALLYKAKELDLDLPVMRSILRSNDNQIELAYKLVKKTGMKKVGVLGLSFKPGTDDLRESPMVELIERLLGKGYEISIHDKEVSLARIVGSNKKYIEQAIPHISSLMKKSVQEVINNSKVIVVGNKSKEYEETVAGINSNTKIIDLIRIFTTLEELNGCYEGICW